MKKPKKVTAAKPLSSRAVSESPKTRAKSLKAEPLEVPDKTAPKKTKLAAKPKEITPAAVGKKIKVEAGAPKPAAKTKRASKTKAVAETKPVLKEVFTSQLLPTMPLQPTAKAKRVAKTKAVLTKPPAEPAKPVVKAESPVPSGVTTPTAKLKRVPKAKIVAAKPAAKTAPPPFAAIPVPEIKPVAPAIAKETLAKPAKPKRAAKPRLTAKSASQPTPIIKTAEPISETKPSAAPDQPEKPAPRPSIAEVKRLSRPPRKMPSRIPSILFEGDKPGPLPIGGPGQRYALGPKPPVEKLKTEGELPASYETGTVLLAARDPHWLYAHWDLSDDQQRHYNGFSRDGHLVLRIYLEAVEGKPAAEIHLHPESRHWFVHVERANTRYVAQLGYYSAAERWTPVSTSAATLTPPDAVSADTSAEFETVPFEVPMEKLLSLVKEAVQENPPLAQALQELRANGHAELPQITPQSQQTPEQRHWPQPRQSPPRARSAQGRVDGRAPWKPSEWTPAQERALAEVISMDHVRRVWMGSLEITELIRRQFLREIASMAAAEAGAPAPTSPAGAVTGISSPAKVAEKEKGFWFNVNAELIVYGATEKDATVTIGGRKIKLRRDGSFSYRFALPDGDYEMPVVAVSADGTDGRAAELKFSRHTEYRGDVGAHPQDPSLQKLLLENF